MKWTLVAALAVSGCASSGYGEVSEYRAHIPGNYATVDTPDGHRVNIKYHRNPTEPTILLQPTVAQSAGAGFLSGLTLEIASPGDIIGMGLREWRLAADAFFAGSGCSVVRVYRLMDVSWEAVYDCPPGSTPPVIGGKWRAVVRPADPAPAATDPAG